MALVTASEEAKAQDGNLRAAHELITLTVLLLALCSAVHCKSFQRLLAKHHLKHKRIQSAAKGIVIPVTDEDVAA